jgi:methylmalonyl-CoA/ethylmalonyl-CoA epimerase
VDVQIFVNPDLRLHHIGVVVPRIEEFHTFYVDVLQYKQCTSVIHDPVQTAFIQFFEIPGSDHYLELVAPDSETSKLQKAARKRQSLNHLCYSCENIVRSVALLKESGCLVIQNPVAAVAFDGRLIAWLMTTHGLLLEIVERGLEGPPVPRNVQQ